MKKVQIIDSIVLTLISLISCTIVPQGVAQRIDLSFSDYTKSYISVDAAKIALTNVKVIDGTGAPSKTAQTVLIENNLIAEIGPFDEVKVPEEFHVIDLRNKTLIPGIVGTHNHMRMHRGALLATSPRLYLACGVTTIQTCGTGNPYEELAITKSINRGEQPGPQIINSGPYLTGPDGKSNFIRFTDEKMIRDTISYWAKQGVKWLKVYRHTRPQDLKIILDEAHKHQLKVAGHLCATTYEEAATLGIDAIEHGFIASYDHAPDQAVGSCSGNTSFRSDVEVNSEEVKQVQQTLIDHGIALSSTLAVFEVLPPTAEADSRDLEIMSPRHLEAYYHRQKRKEELGAEWWFKEEWFQKCVQYDLQFFKQGGFVVAGSDPEAHNLPGFGDQKNYEIFIKAGFKAEEAIQIMTSNGAKLLELENLGTIQKGKIANLVVLDGDLEADPSTIRAVQTVFKDGIGYDPQRLIESIKGNVGSPTDDSMAYFGQKEPADKPEKFAPNLISKPNRYEFGCAFSKNGREFFFAEDNGVKNIIYHSKLKDGVWTEPVKLFQDDSFNYNDPMLSPDESRLYFISNRSLDGSNRKKDIDIWYAERKGEGWSAPINLGPTINSNLNEYYMSFTSTGTLYFASKDRAEDAPQYAYDIYRSSLENGEYSTPQKLPKEINTHRYEADVFIAPDESYMIFCAIRREGLGKGDLYISFKDKDGNWTPSKNMGDTINTDKHELCPFISGDGKYLFFTSNQDIYWVSTDIIEKYK